MSYTIRIQLQNINDSLSVGDSVYYSSYSNIGGFDVTASGFSQIVSIGTVSLINKQLNFIHVEGELNVEPPSTTDYLFFTKNNSVNLSNVKGYYAEVKMVNDNYKGESELFQITLDADLSSK